MKKKTRNFLCCITTLLLMLIMAVPTTVNAAGATTVYIGNTKLTDGSNSIGNGTATLDSSSGTLTLEGVSATDDLYIVSASNFTIIVKGNNSFETAQYSALSTYDVSNLNLQIENDAVLSLTAKNEGNGLYHPGDELNISGSGKLVVNSDYPPLYAKNDVNVSGVTAEITSDTSGIYSHRGNISVENAQVTLNVGTVGLFAQSYNTDEDKDIPSSISLKNSTVNITSDNNSIHCGSGGLLIEDTVLVTKSDVYSVYTDGDVIIRGSDTEINADDMMGIAACNTLTIEGGNITVSAKGAKDNYGEDGNALYGLNGVTISGGTINASAEGDSAIISYTGLITISGENTNVTATSNNKDVATIRNVFDGGISLDAPVSVENKAGGQPVLGINRDGNVAITVGENYNPDNLIVHTVKKPLSKYPDNVNSYFIPVDDDGTNPYTGKIEFCNHTWDTPVWNWEQDFSKATATFTCTKNSSHTRTEDAVITNKTTAAACDTDGKTVYTATVTLGGKTYTDEKAVVIPATGHKYQNGTCTVCGAKDPSSAVTGNQTVSNTISLNKKIKATWKKGNIKATWGKVSNADGYEVYAAKCGNKFTKVKTIKGNKTTSYTLKKIKGKKLNTKASYKVYVKAYRIVNGKKQYIGNSITTHTVGKNNKTYTNPKSVKAAKKNISLNNGKTKKASIKVTRQTSKKKLLKNSHVAKLRYFSTNTKIATVTKNGTIKGTGKGTCTVYAVGANGVKTSIKVTVK